MYLDLSNTYKKKRPNAINGLKSEWIKFELLLNANKWGLTPKCIGFRKRLYIFLQFNIAWLVFNFF